MKKREQSISGKNFKMSSRATSTSVPDVKKDDNRYVIAEVGVNSSLSAILDAINQTWAPRRPAVNPVKAEMLAYIRLVREKYFYYHRRFNIERTRAASLDLSPDDRRAAGKNACVFQGKYKDYRTLYQNARDRLARRDPNYASECAHRALQQNSNIIRNNYLNSNPARPIAPGS